MFSISSLKSVETLISYHPCLSIARWLQECASLTHSNPVPRCRGSQKPVIGFVCLSFCLDLLVWLGPCPFVCLIHCVYERVSWSPGSYCTSHLHMNYQHQIFSIHIHVTFTKCILQKAPQQRKLKRRQEAVTLRTPFQKEKQSSQLICVK